MSTHLRLLVVLNLIAIAASTQRSWSQELKKVKADYSGAVAYAPADPWTRSKVFQYHTGHAGYFYNCDGEECKRFSPYIKWTTNDGPLWPQRRGWIHGLREDLEKVRRRINNGSCGPECCPPDRRGCSNCSQNECYQRFAETKTDPLPERLAIETDQSKFDRR